MLFPDLGSGLWLAAPSHGSGIVWGEPDTATLSQMSVVARGGAEEFLPLS
jgi:hypothetical protein